QGEQWFWLDPNYHYVHYSPATLRKHLEDAGFKVERIYTKRGDYSIKQLREAAEQVHPELRGNDAAFAAWERHNEEKGRGEEIRFFARKPEPVAKVNDAPISRRISETAKARDEGYSFCIITNGKRPEKLAAEIASIRALQIPKFEILVGGEPPAEME